VWDISRWSIEHPGNEIALAAGKQNPILAFAELGSAAIQFPPDHAISRWTTGLKKIITQLGNLYDVIDYADLPPEVQDVPTATFFNSAPAPSIPGGVEACGSPNEVAMNPRLGYRMAYNTRYVASEGGGGAALGGESGQNLRLEGGRAKRARREGAAAIRLSWARSKEKALTLSVSRVLARRRRRCCYPSLVGSL
jgi:hypothetical protein